MSVRPESVARAWNITPTVARRVEQGWNNLVWLLDDAYVLRIYQNLSADRVVREHRFLDALDGAGLPFAVPRPVPTPGGETFVATPDGPAALYRFIPGRTGLDDDERDLALAGAALGDLMTGLARLPLDVAPFDWRGPLSTVHPSVPDIDDLVEELRTQIPGAAGLDIFASDWKDLDIDYEKVTLPVQICHLDFALSNVLIEGDRIVAVLDFEVAGIDLRVSDFVAGLVQSAHDARAEDVFVSAFRSRLDLLPEEWNAVPRLRRLRKIATVVWRAGRWREGKSTLDDVRARLAAVVPG